MSRIKIITLLLLLSLLIISLVFNPNKHDYLIFSEETIGLEIPEDVVVERINFYLFSTYSVQALPYEHGIVHLGFMGSFFQISKGQYDYPSWLEFFN
ncbi:hypothetical protein [Paenisporosarcina sp. NPDC076898]|uniref:hypothetical protein n=1 Tax=unclassified Paenisporosarcina TaxID=2642018 RepID=UPI003D07996E